MPQNWTERAAQFFLNVLKKLKNPVFQKREMVGGMDIEQGGLTAEQGEKSQSGYSILQVLS